MSEKEQPGILPPETGRVLEEIIGRAAAGEDGGWIADYAAFGETISHDIPVSRLHVKDENMGGFWANQLGITPHCKQGR